MSLAGLILIGSLVLIVAAQIIQPFVGALAAVVWCVAATVVGFHIINESLPLHFFFLPRDPILFGITMLGFTSYSVFNLIRSVRHGARTTTGFDRQTAKFSLTSNNNT